MTFRLRLLLREITFDADEVMLGRGPECAMSIEDELLSRRHALIVRVPGGFEIEDLGSRNGTRLNGSLIVEPTLLEDGDRIRVGTSEIVFVLERSDEDDPQRTLQTARYAACLACGQARAAEMVACPSCGTPSPSAA